MNSKVEQSNRKGKSEVEKDESAGSVNIFNEMEREFQSIFGDFEKHISPHPKIRKFGRNVKSEFKKSHKDPERRWE